MCPSPKGWCHASRARGVGCCRKFFVEPCTLSGHGSVNFCACALHSEFCCRHLVSCRGSCVCSVPCSSPRTERACTCPSPKEWYCAGCGRSLGSCRRIVGLCGCCTLRVVVGVVRGNRVGGLCLPWMWMICGVSMFPSVRLEAVVSPGRLLTFGHFCAGNSVLLRLHSVSGSRKMTRTQLTLFPSGTKAMLLVYLLR